MQDYVLPDFSTIKKGFCKVRKHIWTVITERRLCAALTAPLSGHQPKEEIVFSGKYKTGEQILRLANERFAVPEMLFHPSDIGIQEMGIPEAIVDSIQSLPEGLLLFLMSPFCYRKSTYILAFKPCYKSFMEQSKRSLYTEGMWVGGVVHSLQLANRMV